MPQKGDINPATGKAYAVNPATGVWDDTYWATVVEPRLKSGGGAAGTGSTADQLMQASVNLYDTQWNDYKSKSKQFDEANPFNFDKMLEDSTAQVKQRLDPYYTQTLSDFLQGINLQKTRSTEDTRNLLSELSTDTKSYTGSAKMALDKAITQSNQGFADTGLYGSGQQIRTEGQLQTAGDQNLSDSLRGTSARERSINLGASRNAEDLALQERLKTRDIGVDQSYQTQTQSLAETLRRQKQREFEKNQFTGAPPGVSPGQYQNYSYNLLG